MDWMLIWTAVMGIAAVVTILGGIFALIRRSDLQTQDALHTALDSKVNDLAIDVNNKLNEAEFRRFEDRHEASLTSIKENTDNRISRLEAKLDEKFDKLFDMLIKKD